MKAHKVNPRRKGFTLIELLVVIAIIALLLSILMPGLRMARKQARKIICGAHLHGWGLIFAAYGNDNESKFPLWYNNYAAEGNMWMDVLIPYYDDIEKMRFCGEALKGKDRPPGGDHYGGAYIQDRWSLDENYDLPIFLNYGMRYDWQEANDGSQGSPRLGLTYTPDDKTKIRMQYGWFFQVIPLGDAMAQPAEYRYQYGDGYSLQGTMQFDSYRGASGLSNPINKAFEVGIEREIFPDITLGLTYYDKDMQDLLQNVDVNPDPAIDEWQMMNVAGAWARGTEVKVKKAFSKRFEARLAYTYQEAKSVGIDRYGVMTGKEAWLDWDLRHAIALSFNVELPYDINLNGIYSWNSGFPYTLNYLVRNEETDLLERHEDNVNEEREPYYSTFDLTLLKEFKVRDYTLSMMVQSYNLFDHRNVAYMDELKGEAAALEAGRRLLFGMKFEF